jgi:serine/threonine-protein kinase
MGIDSGPVDRVADVNDRSNVAGTGINMAQRVMDCGDAGHILLSKRVAGDLAQYTKWQPQLHDLGEVEVKHGVNVGVVNFFDGDLGNPAAPEKIRRLRQVQAAAARRRAIVWSLGAIALVAALGTAFWIQSRRAGSAHLAAGSAPEKSIAVLPLDNLSEEKENAYFADGIQDELLSNLAKIKDLKVISRTSVMQYKTGITRNLKEIAQQLGVSNVVEGSVRRSGNHIRVSVQLIDALTDRHIWAQNYDRTLADSLALQGELATQIAAEVGATLSPQEKARVEATPTKNTAAYDAYLRGRALAAGLTADRSNLESAIRSYQEAVTLDPSFALAWAYLSCTHSSVYWFGNDPTPARLAAAKDAVDHAVALDPDLAETHLALGYYRYYGARDFKGALEEFQLAEKSLPNDVEVLKAIGLIQRRFGHWDEAIAVLHRVVELDPRNIQSASILGTTYMVKRRFSDALAVADHILAVEPSNIPAIGLKVFSLWAMGKSETADVFLTNSDAPLHLRAHQALNKHQYSDALNLFTKALKEARGEEKNELLLDLGMAQQLAGNVAESKAAYQQAVQELTQELNEMDNANDWHGAELHSSLGVAYAGLGDATRAVAEGQKGMTLQPTSEDPFEGPEREEQMAQIYALLGNADEAIPILQRWIQVPSGTSITPTLLRIDPIWDPIRNDPRFQELAAEKKP